MNMIELSSVISSFFRNKQLVDSIVNSGKIMELQAEEVIIKPGQFIKTVPIVIKGTIKVIRTDRKGNEVFLYYLDPGHTCAISLTCCEDFQRSHVKAVAEEHTWVVSIPVTKHSEWIDEFKEWKDFVSLTYQKRFQELLMAIDEIAFKRMDERLLNYLLSKSKQLKTTDLVVTHQQIANELGTSREVISRLLKQLEKRKWIEIARNKIFVREDLEEFINKEIGATT